AVPITIREQIESTQEAFEVGASIAHCHVRDEDGKPTSDPERFARLKEGLEKYCPGMIIQLSTGGRSGTERERGGMLSLSPDMASLSVGSNNFPTRVYENSPNLVDWLAAEIMINDVKPEIEAFDLSHIVQAARMAAAHADRVIVTDDNPRSEDPAAIRAMVLAGAGEAEEVGDRAEAILYGVDGLQPGDCLLIAGKGHETGQIIGEDILPFDDVEQASISVAALEDFA
ncbi:MAG: 3-keto-5-aminohexanoate cleavage protein, partial [Planktomarina sp.]|nr:3-keto-5-aminohexanoate cleavage protein [Planktomarina sp.]